MIKKICLLSIISLLGVLTACGGATNTTAEVTDNTSAIEASTEDVSSEAAEEPTPEPTPTPEVIIEEALSEGKNLYYGLNRVTADNDKALEAFQKAADLDSAEAYYYIGRIHDRAEDYEEAKTAYDKAIELGNSMAKIGNGLLYLYGRGVDSDYDKAEDLFNSAVSEGCVEANVGLGDFFSQGIAEIDALDLDAPKAVEYYEKATAGNETEWLCYAYASLAQMNCGYFDGIKKDENKIAEYGEKITGLSESWNPIYLTRIADAYYFAEDYEKAFEWDEKYDSADSLRGRGSMYANGLGVSQDNAKAREFFEKAAELGDATSMEWLAYFYQDGIDVDKNIDTAIEWYEKAGSEGSGNAYNEIGKLYYFGEDIEQDYSKALDYFLKGATLKNTDAMLDAGMCYKEGYGTDVDYEKACEYYAMADFYGEKQGGEAILDLLNSGKIDGDTANKWMDYYYK